MACRKLGGHCAGKVMQDYHRRTKKLFLTFFIADLQLYSFLPSDTDFLSEEAEIMQSKWVQDEENLLTCVQRRLLCFLVVKQVQHSSAAKLGH